MQVYVSAYLKKRNVLNTVKPADKKPAVER
jgi:hypothetical protein